MGEGEDWKFSHGSSRLLLVNLLTAEAITGETTACMSPEIVFVLKNTCTVTVLRVNNYAFD